MSKRLFGIITPTNYIIKAFTCKEIVICRAFLGVIFLPAAKVILFALHTVILYSRGHSRSEYHSAKSRISLHSNTTRLKANITEKSNCVLQLLFSWPARRDFVPALPCLSPRLCSLPRLKNSPVDCLNSESPFQEDKLRRSPIGVIYTH